MMNVWINILWVLLFPLVMLVMSLKKRRYGVWGCFALLGQFLLLVSASQLGSLAVRLLFFGIYALVFATDQQFYRRLGWAIEDKILRFALQEMTLTKILVFSMLEVRDWLKLLGMVGLAVLAALVPTLIPMTWAMGVFLLAVALMSASIFYGKQLPPVSNFLSAIIGLWQQNGSASVSNHPERVILPVEPIIVDDTRANILIVVCESLCRRLLHSPEGLKAAPRYHAFLSRESAAVVHFSAAIANATASDVSYPSIFTGLSPEESDQRFHRNPLIWAQAKAKGYKTMLYSSQTLAWCHLDRFMLDDSLDHAVHRDVLNAPAFNELAMDDRILNKVAMVELSHEVQPFCAVVNYNMLHYPYMNGKKKAAVKGVKALQQYMLALRRFDECLGDLIDALDASGKLKNTTILFTGDHGESPEHTVKGSQGPMPLRVNDFTPDVLRIPFWIRLSEDAATSVFQHPLTANAETIVSNVDIYPTVMHLLGHDADSRDAWSSGQSLLAPLPAQRNVVAFNTGALRHWKYEPFAIGSDGWLLMYHDVSQKLELLRLTDPLEQDVWDTLSGSAQAKWLSVVAECPMLHEILVNRGLSFALPSHQTIADEYNRLASMGDGAELHKLNNWLLFSAEDWREMCHKTFQFIGIEKGDHVFEAGCGAGAFLDTLRRHTDVQVAGIDIAENLIEIVRQRVPGNFWVGDIQDLSFAPSERYDKVVSHGVFLYLASRAAVRLAALEMIRITKPGGAIYIGVMNDPDRIKTYKDVHPPSGNTFVGRDFWEELAAQHDLEFEIVDQDKVYSKPEGYDGHSRLRYSVRMKKR